MDETSPSLMLLRMAEVIQLTGVSKSTIYALMGEGEFPPPVRIGKRIVRWLAAEIDAWIAARAARRT